MKQTKTTNSADIPLPAKAIIAPAVIVATGLAVPHVLAGSFIFSMALAPVLAPCMVMAAFTKK